MAEQTLVEHVDGTDDDGTLRGIDDDGENDSQGTDTAVADVAEY